MRLAAPKRSGRASRAGAVIHYVVGELLHSLMLRRMMLGLTQRAERCDERDGGPVIGIWWRLL
jgi:hypothetical protein